MFGNFEVEIILVVQAALNDSLTILNTFFTITTKKVLYEIIGFHKVEERRHGSKPCRR